MKDSLKKYLTPTLLLLTIAAIQFITMPRFFYPGDNFAPRIEVKHWIETGSLAMPIEMKKQFAGFFSQRGQYFFENDEKNTFSSKYGIGNTLAYIIPTLAESLAEDSTSPTNMMSSNILFINLWQIIITLGICTYLYLALGLYTSKQIMRSILIILTIYTTFLWHYLRAPTLDIFQILPFIASFYHMTKFLRAREQENPQSPCWRHLAAAISYSCLLVWLKPFFAVQCIIMALFALSSGHPNTKLPQRLLHNIKTHPKQYLFALIVPAICMAAVVLFANGYKFGNPLNTGYSQWMQNDHPHDRFALSYIPIALKGFFIRLSNANIVLHFPLIIPALFALPLLWKQYGQEKFLLLSLALSNLLLLCTFSVWSGEWCYGPRYLLHFAILFTLPLPLLVEWLLQNNTRWLKWAVLIPVTPILIWSLTMQIYINSLTYFAYHQTKGTYDNFKQERISAYFKSISHRGKLHADLINHKSGRTTFPPQKTLSSMVAPQHRNIIQQLEMFLSNQTQWNYYFCAENKRKQTETTN